MSGGKLLFCIFIFISCLTYSQRLVIRQDSMTVGDFFRQIEVQTPYTVAYSHARIHTETKIAVPASFGNIRLKDALVHVSRVMPCAYAFEGNHVIFFPKAEKAVSNPVYSDGERQFVFSGTVMERQTLSPMEHATVYLFDGDERILAAGITGATGMFRLAARQIPRKIKITFVGCETFSKEINTVREDLGAFLMDESGVSLDEISIAGKNRTGRDIYRITPEMRAGTFGAMDLLDKIRDLQRDNSSQSVRVDNRANVLLMLNGMPQTASFMENLPSQQIRSIEIIREPAGRFISGNCEAIVNFVRDDDAEGYDVFASNISAVNLSGSNGEYRLAEECPAAGISFMKGRVGIHGVCSWNSERWNMPMEKDLTYDGVKAPPADHHNNLYRSQNLNATASITYRPDDRHTILFQSDCTTGNMYSEYTYMTQGNILTDISNRTLKNMTENMTIDRILTESVSYSGAIGNRLRLRGDFTFNHYYNDMESRYGQAQDRIINNRDENLYNEYKNHTLLNVETSYLLTAETSLDAGYTNSWREYASESSHGKGFLDYNEYRNVFFAYFLWTPSAAASVKSGLGVEHVKIRNRQSVNDFNYFLPYLKINYRISRDLDASLNYSATSRYPVLYQISPMSVKVDSLLSQTGNPALLPSLRHKASIRFNYAGKLTVEPSFHYTYNGFSESYLKNEYMLYRTFRNINTREYALYGSYDQYFGKNFRLTGSLTLYSAAVCGEAGNTASGWTAHAEADYRIPKHHMDIQAGYYRNMKKNILLQGYQMLDKDSWMVTLHKLFPRQGVSVVLTYIPPLTWGVRQEQVKYVDTPLCREMTRLNLDACYNVLVLKVNFRFNTGIRQTKYNSASDGKGERQKITVEL